MNIGHISMPLWRGVGRPPRQRGPGGGLKSRSPERPGIYIYIYRERERNTYMCIYIYIYITYICIYVNIYIERERDVYAHTFNIGSDARSENRSRAETQRSFPRGAWPFSAAITGAAIFIGGARQKNNNNNDNSNTILY